MSQLMTISDKANAPPFLLKKHNKNNQKKPNKKRGDIAKTNFLPYGKLLKYSFVRIQSIISVDQAIRI